MIRFAVSATLILCLSFVGSTSTSMAQDDSPSSDCFFIRSVSSWSALDRDHVYLKEGVNDHYLATLFSSCPGLKFAHAIALSNHNGRMCPNDFGAITFKDGGMRRTCRITNIEAVASKDEAAAIAESRSAEEDTE